MERFNGGQIWCKFFILERCLVRAHTQQAKGMYEQVRNLASYSLACPHVICALSQYYLGGFREDAVAE